MQNTAIQEAQQSDFNLANIIRSIISDPNLTHGAGRVLVQLVLASGRKGYCYLFIDTVARLGNIGRTQAKRYLGELETKHYIKVIRRPGRSNVYQMLMITDDSNEVGRLSGYIKQCIKKRKRLRPEENVLVICEKTKGEIMPIPPATNPVVVETTDQKTTSSNPPQAPAPRTKPIRFDLVKKILTLTGDKKSFGLWVKFVRTVPLETVYMAISSLEVALSCDQVASPGRYLVGIIKNIYPELFKQAPWPSQDAVAVANPPQTSSQEPSVERDWKLNLSRIQEIKALLESRQPSNQKPKRHRSIDINEKAPKMPVERFCVLPVGNG